MFRQTRVRLTIWNACVFILLISILGSVVYFYSKTYLYKNIDRSIDQMVHRIQTVDRLPQISQLARNPRMTVLIWDDNHNLVNPVPQNTLFHTDQSQFVQKQHNELQVIQVKNYYFKSLTIPVQGSMGDLNVQVLRDVTSEKDMLNQLVIIMIVGCGIGIILAVIAGLFLSKKALVPINQAWQKQQQFVSDASHELRTPLSVIQSKLGLLFQSPSSSIQDKAKDISVALNESRRLTRLVSELLTLARSDSDQLEMDKKLFSLDELLKDLVDHYQEIASYQNKTLTLDTSGPVTFNGDPERMHQMMVIFIDNALKFTGENGDIRLSLSESHHSISIQINDNGVGIPDRDISKIFERFYQTDQSRTAEAGTGLGLSIAEWIVDKHWGTINVQSKLDEGTRFNIVLPKNQKR
ncbi:sensor histidine kinase [Tuberibacillus sp. Marseille-P3662]|uniref:sensor histidine kinase n=1 Tax=Tuberibacillus sp. Marseille-P3662 TaxID=1965358 RepID=UPI000A1CB81C|nr:HAMP domain-containing sensor histidine kinase [Tuberibacillus sp. Marseille-P3662]